MVLILVEDLYQSKRPPALISDSSNVSCVVSYDVSLGMSNVPFSCLISASFIIKYLKQQVRFLLKKSFLFDAKDFCFEFSLKNLFVCLLRLNHNHTLNIQICPLMLAIQSPVQVEVLEERLRTNCFLLWN